LTTHSEKIEPSATQYVNAPSPGQRHPAFMNKQQINATIERARATLARAVEMLIEAQEMQARLRETREHLAATRRRIRERG
jgi:vacuolar-type H+-ATPase subunit D/Vma8